MTKSNHHRILLISTLIGILLVSYGVFLDFSNFTDPTSKDLLGLVLSFVASILGIIFVILEVQEKTSMFMTGIIGSLCSVLYLYFWSPLLWDMSIALVYIILNLYGLYYWTHPEKKRQREDHSLNTKRLTLKEWYKYLIICLIGIIVLYYLGMLWGKYSSPLQAATDATTTVLAILAQWLVTKKYLEMWYLWILVNIISIPLYMSINSYAYVMVYIYYLVMSFYGLYTWKQNMSLIKNKVLSK